MARRKGAVTFKTRFKNLTFDIEKLRANDMLETPKLSKAKKLNFNVEHEDNEHLVKPGGEYNDEIKKSLEKNTTAPMQLAELKAAQARIAELEAQQAKPKPKLIWGRLSNLHDNKKSYTVKIPEQFEGHIKKSARKCNDSVSNHLARLVMLGLRANGVDLLIEGESQ